MIGLLISFALLSIVMVLAMVPLSIELLGASTGMPEHRRRLRGLGGVGVLTELLLPRALDQHSPRQFWAVAYGLCWSGLFVVAGLLISRSPPQERLHNLIVLALVAGGWWSVHGAIVWLGRALNRTNQRARRRRSAVEPAEDAHDATRSPAADTDLDEQPATPEPALPIATTTPAQAPAGKGRRAIAPTLCLLGALLLIGIGDAVAEQSPTLQSADRLLNEHHGLLLGLTIGLAALGFVTFMGAILDLILSRGQPASREEIEALHARSLVTRAPVLARASTYTFAGEALGAGARDEWSLGQMKQAWRSRAWRGSRVWKRRFIVCSGVLMLMLGLFGLIIVVGPWGVRLLIGLVMLYVAIRTTWAVYRAE